MPKVLIIEDDDVIARGMASHLTAGAFEPLWVAKARKGLARLRYERSDVCLVDLTLPGVDGWRADRDGAGVDRDRGPAHRSADVQA